MQITDIEARGLVHQLKGPESFLCAVCIDVDTEEVRTFRDIYEYRDFLESDPDGYVFHNGIGYDYYAMEKMGAPLTKSRLQDTLVLSRLAYPKLMEMDAANGRRHGRSFPVPGYLYGSHSLKAWGLRLGNLKGDFVPDDWTTVEFSQEMLDYCIQDCWVTLDLYRRVQNRGLPTFAAKLEHDIAWLMKQQELNGFCFDVKAAELLYAELAADRTNLEHELKTVFGSWYVANGKTVPKRTVKYKDRLRADLTAGAPYTKIKRVEFNPGSRAHVARCFKKWYGWKPTIFTDSGEPKVDSDVLEQLDFPEAPLLKKYFDINKTIGQLAEGKNGWLRLVSPDGFIHGSVNPNGAGTGRATHSRPNTAQVPKGSEGSVGWRCRELFTVPRGFVLLGTDASGLELRALGNRLAPYDGGAYAREVVEGDVHWVNVLALGLMPIGTVRDKHNPDHEAARDKSKTWVYAFLYGAGDELLGANLGYTEDDVNRWREAGAHKKVIANLKRRGEPWTRHRVSNILKGNEARRSFLKQIPAVKEFQKACKSQHEDNKCVIGLDGRKIPTRSAHSATNFQLQGDGALVCKLWGTLFEEMLQEAGFKHGWDGDYAFCAWVHDEYQIACRPEHAETIGEIGRKAMHRVAEIFEFSCPLDADFDIGPNWANTH